MACKSIESLYAAGGFNDETNGLCGLSMIEMLRADLLVLALAINGWQAAVSVADLKPG